MARSDSTSRKSRSRTSRRLSSQGSRPRSSTSALSGTSERSEPAPRPPCHSEPFALFCHPERSEGSAPVASMKRSRSGQAPRGICSRIRRYRSRSFVASLLRMTDARTRTSVAPPGAVGALRRARGGVLRHLLDPFGERERARPAVGLSRAVEDRSSPGRVHRRGQEVVQAMNGVVQVVSVHLAGGDVDLAGELAADPAPVLLEIGGQVRMLPPVGRDALVDRARLRIEERLEIAVLPEGTKDRLPAIPVLARAAVGTQGAFVSQLLLHRRADDPLGVALARQRHAKEPRVPVPGVLPVVDVDDLEAVKVHRIGARRKSSAEVVRMKDLQRERLPSPRGPARENPRPRFTDRAKVRFDVWDQLRQDHLTVRPVVGRIDRVGIVVVRRRMLERDVEHSRKAVGEPGLREFLPSPRSLLLPLGCAGGKLDTLAEAAGVGGREMSLLVVDRVRDALVLLIVARQEDRRPDEDGLSPELREKRALKPYALDVLAVRRDLDRRDLLRERQAHGFPAAGVQAYLPDLAVEVAGGDLKDLPLPLIGVELDGVPVRPAKRRVDVEHPLDEVIARRDVRQPCDRIPERRAADDGPFSRREILDVRAEERRRTVLASFLAELQAGLGLSFPRNHHEDTPVGGLAADASRERKLA